MYCLLEKSNSIAKQAIDSIRRDLDRTWILFFFCTNLTIPCALGRGYIPVFTNPVTLSSISLSDSPANDSFFSLPNSYLANTFGSVPSASRSRIGVCGLFFFMVGYARVRNDLMAELWSDVWQKRKRTSLSPCVKAYLPDMAGGGWRVSERFDADCGIGELML